jgi:hypothetical protein
LNVVSLTVYDPSGNNATCNANVTVADTTPPTAICSNPTLYLDSLGALTITLNQVAAASFDNCGFATTTLSQSVFGCQDVGPKSVTVTLVDPSGNSRACTSNITVADNRAPTALCSNTTLYLNASGNASLGVNQVDNGSFDACGIVSRTLSKTSFHCSDVGVQSVTLTATDVNLNIGTCTAMITVLDTIRPVAICIQDTVFLDSSGLAPVVPANLNNGSSDVCGIDTSFTNLVVVNCTNIGNNLVTLTVQDPSGNADSCTATLWVFDNQAPLAICDSIVLQLDSSGTGTITPALIGPNSVDNCSISASVVLPDTFYCSDFGYQTATLFVSDPYNNQSSCVGVVHVVDTLGISTVDVDLGGDAVVCNGDTLILDAGPGQSAYTWSTSATTQTIGVSAAGTYSVNVVSPQGCSGGDTVTITTRTIPDPNLRTESNEQVICQNDSLLLIVNSNYASYLWSNGSTGPTSLVFTGGIYSVTVTDTGGCSLTRTINIQFVPFPAPNPNIMPGNPAFYCEGELIDLDAGPGYFAYRWNTNQTSQIITAFQPGTYQVQVWNGFGCHSTSPPVTVTELAAPAVTIQQNGNVLTTSAVGTYQWLRNNVPISGATQQSYTATQSGSYTVTVTYPNGCIKTSDPTSVIVSVDPISEALRGLQVYPNPSGGDLYLAPVQPIREPVTVQVNDLYGRELSRVEFRNLTRERKIDLSALPAGVYLLEITGKDGRVMHKIVRE